MKNKIQQNTLKQRCVICGRYVFPFQGFYSLRKEPGNKYDVWHGVECDKEYYNLHKKI